MGLHDSLPWLHPVNHLTKHIHAPQQKKKKRKEKKRKDGRAGGEEKDEGTMALASWRRSAGLEEGTAGRPLWVTSIP